VPEAAAEVPEIKKRMQDAGCGAPLIGDFQYNGHLLLTKYPECARALDKYRINPGNVGVGERHDENFRRMIDAAKEHGKPVRIGVNWGSLDRALLTDLMNQNARRAEPVEDREVVLEAMKESALRSAALAESFGLGHDRIILSAKVSDVRDLVSVYRALAAACDYPLHLGLTEAGLGAKGIVRDSETGGVKVALVADVGEDALVVHDAHNPDPTLAFAISRLTDAGYIHQSPIGIFRQVERPTYDDLARDQLVTASAGTEDRSQALAGLLNGGDTWSVA
jgi:(E)-4-hydroxy-3-methylbut-2-enyl-diphosphate synthase